ncbi:MAG: protein-disulfide reductase DsbD family protein, partial [Stellaceae bacterium]
VGWGMQFQSPVFLAAMAAIVALFAANLLGLFEIRLPRAIADRLGGAPLGNVATGAFATLLATPCSAPFLGTAVGFALAAGPVEIVAVFLALGVGFAAPYLVVAALPRLAFLLPRPGRWTLMVRKVLGLALAATAVWLVAVLADAAVAPQAEAAGIWRPFDATALGPLVHDGKVVFVDVTAEWCLTCEVNERFVLDTPEVQQKLKAAGVVAMRADWTRPNPAITDYLQRFGRYGIPFNVVYGPGAPAGVALPEILTSANVIAALDRAAGRGDDFSQAPLYGRALQLQ